jgi:hypothetical protein
LASFALLPQATRRVDELLELTADVEVAYSDVPDLPVVAAWRNPTNRAARSAG